MGMKCSFMPCSRCLNLVLLLLISSLLTSAGFWSVEKEPRDSKKVGLDCWINADCVLSSNLALKLRRHVLIWKCSKPQPLIEIVYFQTGNKELKSSQSGFPPINSDLQRIVTQKAGQTLYNLYHVWVRLSSGPWRRPHLSLTLL